MKKASWILLALVGALTLLGSLASLTVAYRGGSDPLLPAGPTIEEVAAGRPEVHTALRARRATAAAYAAAYAALVLAVILGPYRRGDTWAWWALLTASVVLAVLVALRVPMLGTKAGVAAGLTQLAVVVVALLLDVRRLQAARA
jgi:hypothetical protein